MNGTIIGDIVGSVYEFHTIKQKQFKLFKPHCFFTDDTVMTCAIALASMEYKEHQDYEKFKASAEKNMRRLGQQYPNAGYGESFYDWIQDETKGAYNSYGNGAAMRTSSVAYVAKNLEECERLAEIQASLSHNHPEGIKGAKAISACIFLARTGASKEKIKEYIDQQFYTLDFTIEGIRRKYQYDISAQGSVPQAITAFLESTDYEDCIRNAICLGGDADTLAAMAGGIAEAFYGIPYDIENKLYNYLETDLLEIIKKFDKVNPRKIRFNLPEELDKIMSKINEQGYEAYITGETARNIIMGSDVLNYEIATNMPSSLLNSLYSEEYKKKILTEQHNMPQINYHHFTGNNIKEYLKTKIYTINAVALDKEGRIIDPFDGINDIYARNIALVNDNTELYTLNPAEIMKTIKIAAKLNFKISAQCKKQILASKNRITAINPETIFPELLEILSSNHPEEYLEEFKEVILLIIPEFQENKMGFSEPALQKNDCYEHTLRVLKNTNNNIYLRLAALFHDISSPATIENTENIDSSFERNNNLIFDKIADRFNIANETRVKVKQLIQLQNFEISKNPKSAIYLLNIIGPESLELLLDLMEAKIKSKKENNAHLLDQFYRVKSFYQNIIWRMTKINITNLKINEQVLREKGIADEKIEKVLQEIFKEVLCSTVKNTEEELVNYVERKYK